jgi:hypothetical protein
MRTLVVWHGKNGYIRSQGEHAFQPTRNRTHIDTPLLRGIVIEL